MISDTVVNEHIDGVVGISSAAAGMCSDSFASIMSRVRFVHAEGGGFDDGSISIDALKGTAQGLTLRSAFCVALFPRRRSLSLCGQELVRDAVS